MLDDALPSPYIAMDFLASLTLEVTRYSNTTNNYWSNTNTDDCHKKIFNALLTLGNVFHVFLAAIFLFFQMLKQLVTKFKEILSDLLH